MKRIFGVLVLVCLLGSFFVNMADAATVNAKKRKYNKNALPYGWQSEFGYTVWRMQRGLMATRQTYMKYRREKARNPSNSIGEYVTDGLDWTNEEVAKFWEDYQEWLKFHPSGVAED